MAYTIVWEPQGIFWQFSGVVSGKDLIQANLDVYGDSQYENIRYEIVDFLQVTEFNVSKDDVEQVARFDHAASISSPYMFVAIIANSDAIQLMSQHYSDALSPEWSMSVFDNEADARQWTNARNP